jgi:hypothetical protein
MRYLALLLQLPLFAIFVWIYLTVPPDLARTPSRRLFDIAAILLALLASVLAMLFAYDADIGHVGLIWKQVAAVLAAFHSFPLVLAIAWFVRGRVFGVAQKSR